MRRALTLAAATLALAGCGERQETLAPTHPRALTITLVNAPSTLYAPIYAAQAAGDFARAGLAVQIASVPTFLPATALPTAEVRVGPEWQLLRARAYGLQYVSVGALIQSVPPPVTVHGSDPAYAAMRAGDAPLTAAHAPPYSPLVFAVPVYQAHYDGPLLRAFLHAVMLGAQAAQANPQLATTAVLAADRRLNARFELALARATMSVAFPSDSANPYGFQDPNAWETFGNWMYSRQMLQANPDAQNALTNEFLAGQGESTDNGLTD